MLYGFGKWHEMTAVRSCHLKSAEQKSDQALFRNIFYIEGSNIRT